MSELVTTNISKWIDCVRNTVNGIAGGTRALCHLYGTEDVQVAHGAYRCSLNIAEAHIFLETVLRTWQCVWV